MQQRVVHRRDRHERRWPPTAKEFQHPRHLKSSRVHHGAAKDQGEQRGDGESETVKLRQHAEKAISLGEVDPPNALIDIGCEVGDGELHALGTPRGARRIEHHGDVLIRPLHRPK